MLKLFDIPQKCLIFLINITLRSTFNIAIYFCHKVKQTFILADCSEEP